MIPKADELPVKKEFKQRYESLLGKEYKSFMTCSLSFLRRSIRVNILKITVSDLKKSLEKDWKLTPIPWCKEGFWIKHKREKRRDIGNWIEHSLGYIYVQEAASMIPPLVLNPRPGDLVLDMCASPGSKSTQIASMMKNRGVLVCNDYKGDRLKALGINLQRSGVINQGTTLMDGRQFLKKGLVFDKILVDAPCSGTGTIRKSLKTLEMWNPNMIKRLKGTQKQLIETAFNILKKKGVMVYSTCTLEPEEDEAVVSYLLNKYSNAKIQPIKLDIKQSKPITNFKGEEYNKEVKNCLRIWPQDNDTEGFFVAKIKKD